MSPISGLLSMTNIVSLLPTLKGLSRQPRQKWRERNPSVGNLRHGCS
jgi:hypothetical protein